MLRIAQPALRSGCRLRCLICRANFADAPPGPLMRPGCRGVSCSARGVFNTMLRIAQPALRSGCRLRCSICEVNLADAPPGPLMRPGCREAAACSARGVFNTTLRVAQPALRSGCRLRCLICRANLTDAPPGPLMRPGCREEPLRPDSGRQHIGYLISSSSFQSLE